MSEHGYPDFQRYAQWFGAPLVDASAFAIGAGSHTDGPLQVNNWSSVILYVKPTGGTITATVRQTSSGILSGLVSDTVITIAAGSTVVRSVVLLGNQVSLILQGSAPGETVDYSLVPSNTAVNTGTVSTPTIGVQHNEVLVANEAAIDFVDAAGAVWTITDDVANGRVKITPARMVTGRVSGAGAVQAGTGFTAARTGAGGYTMTFNPVFSAVPVVVCTTATGARYILDVTAVAVNQFLVSIFDFVSGAGTDNDFSFIAMLPA